ncbi:hypothetical protein J1N35_013992, partial [Gossypium stocksii]
FCLGEEYSNAKLVRKVVRSFLEHFAIKVTIIKDAKDIDTIGFYEIIESL